MLLPTLPLPLTPPVALLVSVVAAMASPAHAQLTGDPIPTSAPIASWTLTLEDVAQIPNSSGNPPRLEQLVGNPATGLAYVIDQRGFIYTFDPTLRAPAPAPVPVLFLDLEAAVGDLYMRNEAGVRSLAFHPDFDTPGELGYRKMYVSFSRTTASSPVGNPVEFDSPGLGDHVTVVAEWKLDSEGDIFLGTYRELMRIEQVFPNHNAGHLGFDPTALPGDEDYGLLYIAVGDGGGAGDPFDLAQDIDATPTPYPHGKILRINPLPRGGAPYSIPDDNPFAGMADRVEEIWAYGMRNPHKFHWDRVTGFLYVSDIGQGVVEEISRVGRGDNLGWNDREGSFVYESTSLVSPLPPDHRTDGFTYPVAQYDHLGNGLVGTAAIAGGPIYRGDALPTLSGTMFFADFASNPGPIFAVHVSRLSPRDDFSNLGPLADGRLAPFEEVLIEEGGSEKTFRTFLQDVNGDPGIFRTDLRWGEGPDGEIYVLNKQDGMVRRIAAANGHPGPPGGVPGIVGWALGALLVGLLGVGTWTIMRARAPRPGRV